MTRFVRSMVDRLRSGAGSLSRQFALVVAIGVAPVLVALVIVSLLMFVPITRRRW